MGIVADIAKDQQTLNRHRAEALEHLAAHPLYGRRRYRRGHRRCPVCGGFLSWWEIELKIVDRMTGVSDVLRGAGSVQSASATRLTNTRKETV